MPNKAHKQMREDLNKRIASEAKIVFDSASTNDLTSFHSEVEIKSQIRNELCDIFMSDEMVQALWAKDNILDDAYNFYVNENKSDQVFLAVHEYLEKAEHDYIADELYNRVSAEYEEYVAGVKKMPPEKIIDEAYSLTVLYDLVSCLEPWCVTDYSTEQLKALMSLESPLWSLRQSWMRCDISYMDGMKDMIVDSADIWSAETKSDYSNYFETNSEQEDEDELEP